MPKKISLLLPNDVFENLREEAARARISVSDTIREKILQYENANPASPPALELSSNLQNQLSEILSLVSKNQKLQPASDPAILEILFLLRELLLQRDGAILRKVDTKLDQLFGKERKKIL